MKLSKIAVASSFALSMLFANTAAHAYSFDGSALTSPNSVDYTFNSTGNAGSVSFDLIGYNTLDGYPDNGYEDYFTLSVNGTAIFSGSFNLGGDGNATTLSIGSTSSISNYVYNGFGNGGSLTVNLPVALNIGSNTLTFAYTSAIPQGLGDEGWGVKNLTVSTVPEPENVALMLAGLGLVGFASRKKSA